MESICRFWGRGDGGGEDEPSSGWDGTGLHWREAAWLEFWPDSEDVSGMLTVVLIRGSHAHFAKPDVMRSDP